MHSAQENKRITDIIPHVKHLSLCCLTLTVLVATIDAQWEGMGDVGSARYERYFPHAQA